MIKSPIPVKVGDWAFFVQNAFLYVVFYLKTLSVNSLIPKPINTTPLILFKITSIEGFFLRFSLNFDASNAKQEHHIKPVTAKVNPKMINDTML